MLFGHRKCSGWFRVKTECRKGYRNPRGTNGEEPQNGRDIKIDILDHVIRTPEVFQIVSGKTGVPEGLPEPPGGTNGPPWALLEREECSQDKLCPLESE